MRGGHAVLTSEPRAGRARRLARAPLPRGFSRVRDRLLAALFVLLCSAVLLTVGGWAGIRRTQDALVDVQEDILPEISNAMALVEQSSQLVSAIPKLVESASPAQLAMQRESAESLLALIDQRARELRTPPEDLRYVISRLRDGLGRSLPELTQRTQQKLVAEGGLAADLATLNELDRSFDTTAPDAPPLDPRLRPLWSSLVQGAMATDEPTIGRLEADVEVQAHRLQDAGLLDTLSPAQRDALARLAAGPRSILAYRHELIRLKADISYLDALSAADAGNLREEMARYVAELRRSAAGRSALVRAKTHDNELLMLGLTLLCITISGMATHYVGRLVREIENIARLMTRLAKGHTDQATPAIARSDELGELARSFDVFREILLAKQQLLRDLNAQRELLETVHQSLTDGLAVFDEHDRLRLWNRRLADMLAGPGARLSAGATPRELF
ncbi:MAG TPA: HAMP domain-containing protein, partial [Burkholderiaceae bacterium]